MCALHCHMCEAVKCQGTQRNKRLSFLTAWMWAVVMVCLLSCSLSYVLFIVYSMWLLT